LRVVRAAPVLVETMQRTVTYIEMTTSAKGQTRA
jgi:hypothetical protein